MRNAKTIAVVGLTDNASRASYGVSSYLQSKGYRVVPINPNVSEVLGEKSYPSLIEAAKVEKIDIVDVFRRPDAVPAIVDEVLALKLPVLWLQETVVHEAAAEKARKAGVTVVMDKCIFKEHRKLGL
ncbi:MAG TPA: CoA-binding protein [Candidatus Saccharimonadales bacterium]|nr:CoA-binding protein [Candidatus Saccharimonadales bacterium]